MLLAYLLAVKGGCREGTYIANTRMRRIRLAFLTLLGPIPTLVAERDSRDHIYSNAKHLRTKQK
eukprot:1150638-Pelagomonas_calceolata.AAC.2